mgnify:CR=1 FL=1
MTEIIFFDFGTRENILVNPNMNTSYINNIKLNEKVVIKGIVYNVSDIRYDFDENTLRFGITREGFAR